jgi:hypothetical protein
VLVRVKGGYGLNKPGKGRNGGKVSLGRHPNGHTYGKMSLNLLEAMTPSPTPDQQAAQAPVSGTGSKSTAARATGETTVMAAPAETPLQ